MTPHNISHVNTTVFTRDIKGDYLIQISTTTNIRAWQSFQASKSKFYDCDLLYVVRTFGTASRLI